MHRSLAAASRVRAENRRHLELLVQMTQRWADQGDAERVLRAATVAAGYAWSAPTGLLGDLRLERAVVHAVRGPVGAVEVDGERRTGRVLHVASEVYPTGGHTRLLWRWVERDHRAATLALTNQRSPVPDRLAGTVLASGGRVHDLRAALPGFLDRARALRALMDEADLVVLHVHPYDAVALAAAALPGRRPPVIYENHTDQSFWLGLGAVDLLCDLRPEARQLDESLRGVPGSRIAVLPMPMEQLPTVDGAAAREHLGIGAAAVVALTVSADWKMAPSWGRGMQHVADRALRWSPDLSLVVVGAPTDADWERLRARYPGRVHVVGRVADPSPFFAAADIYLDSYPVRSTTSALEAAALGLPVVTLTDLPEGAPGAIMQANSPGLAGGIVVPTVERLATTVRRLAADRELRRAAGERVRASALAAHEGPGWRASLEDLYARARLVTAADVDLLGPTTADDRHGDALAAVQTPQGSPDPQSTTHLLAEQFDGAMQAGLFAALHRDTGPSLGLRVPAGWEDHLGWVARLVELAGDRPRLRVSLPFVTGDDAAGTRTSALLLDLLDRVGTTPETCGDLVVEVVPAHVRPAVAGELPFTDEALTWLDEMVGSPCWGDPPPVATSRATAGSST